MREKQLLFLYMHNISNPWWCLFRAEDMAMRMRSIPAD